MYPLRRSLDSFSKAGWRSGLKAEVALLSQPPELAAAGSVKSRVLTAADPAEGRGWSKCSALFNPAWLPMFANLCGEG